MITPDRIISMEVPQTIEKLGNGTYYYNYDITQDPDTLLYSFIQVMLPGHPNEKECVKAIIRQHVTVDLEFDLINSYNSYVLNINDVFPEEYTDYLNLLLDIKAKVKSDFGK